MKKILILSFFAAVVFGAFSPAVFAEVAPFSASFGSTPLFSVSNFLPGEEARGDITITNGDTFVRSAYIQAVNVSNDGGLADEMNLKIFDGSREVYNGNFGTFLNSGPTFLSEIETGNSKKYDLKIYFAKETGNGFQGKSLGFDICVGFEGGEQTCSGETGETDAPASISARNEDGDNSQPPPSGRRRPIPETNQATVLGDSTSGSVGSNSNTQTGGGLAYDPSRISGLGSVLGESDEDFEMDVESDDRVVPFPDQSNLASVFEAGWPDFIYDYWWVIILLIAAGFYIYFKR